MNTTPALTIARWRSRAPAAQPVVARLAAEALAGEVAEALPALPPQSILLLRRLELRLPGFDADRLPSAALRRQTADAARDLLADAYRLAASPARSLVPVDALAVLFGDEAEMLACLARDAAAGRLDVWWWRALLGRSFPHWRVAWRERPNAVPAALRLLARAVGEGAPHPASVEDDDLRRDAFAAAPPPGGESPAASPARAVVRGRGGAARAPNAAAAVLPAQAEGSGEACAPSAAMRPTIDEAAGGFPVGAGRAVDATATPRRTAARAAPMKPRSSPAQPRTAEAVVASPTGGAASSTAAPREGIAPSPTPAPPAYRPFGASPASAPMDVSAAPTVLPTVTTGEADSRAPRRRAAAPPAVPVRTDRAASTEAPAAAALSASPTRVSQPPASSTLATASSAAAAAIAQPLPGRMPRQPPTAAPADAAIAPEATHCAESAWPLDTGPRLLVSRYGRLLLLVNMLLGDDLYPDFTRPAERGFPVPLWRLLAWLGDGLIGAAFAGDPLAALLQELAGEETPLVGVDFARAWPVPRPMPRRFRPVRRCWPVFRRFPAGDLSSWLARYRHSLRNRLALALDLPPAAIGPAIAQDGPPARLWVSEAELVVVLSLDDHPVAWRLAGLDRDPGYLPSVGRTLRFVFD